MANKKSYLVALLLTAGIFTSYSHAEDQVKEINDSTALETLIYILEKGEQGIVNKNNFHLWQGSLSNHDTILKQYLIESNLYNETNADIFIRSVSQDEIADLIEVLNDENLQNAIGAAAITFARLGAQ